MFDKLKFWKKEEDEFNDLPSTPFPESQNPAGSDPFAAPQKDPFAHSPINDRSREIPHPTQMPPVPAAPPEEQRGFSDRDFGIRPPEHAPPPQQTQPYQQTPGSLEQQMQMINLKLDAIKTAIENINMRMERLEHQQQRY